MVQQLTTKKRACLKRFSLLSLWVLHAALNGQVVPSTEDDTAVEKGKASYYADHFKGSKTASGAIYQPNLLTAAHKTLPFGTLVKVTCRETKKSVIVTINDRGPFSKKRIIDLSRAAFQSIHSIRKGEIHVEVRVLKPMGGN
jgi:rare lipoprotein A